MVKLQCPCMGKARGGRVVVAGSDWLAVRGVTGLPQIVWAGLLSIFGWLTASVMAW